MAAAVCCAAAGGAVGTDKYGEVRRGTENWCAVCAALPCGKSASPSHTTLRHSPLLTTVLQASRPRNTHPPAEIKHFPGLKFDFHKKKEYIIGYVFYNFLTR